MLKRETDINYFELISVIDFSARSTFLEFEEFIRIDQQENI
jgi:hypothetical protein